MELVSATIGAMLEKTSRQWPQGVAVMDPGDGSSATWQQLDEMSDVWARGFLAKGIIHGSHVALWSTNSLPWVVCFLAAAKIGAITIPININYRHDEIVRLLQLADTEVLVLMENFRDIDYLAIADQMWGQGKNGVADEVSTLKTFIAMGKKPDAPAFSIDEIIEAGKSVTDEELARAKAAVAIHDTAAILFTSGTTGEHKGVMLTHHNLVNNSLFSGVRLGVTQEDRLCVSVPCFHCFGLSASVMQCIGTGTTMVLIPCYSTSGVLRTLQDYKCTVLHGVPTMFKRLMEHPRFGDYDLSSLDRGLISGANVEEKLLRDITEKMGMPNIAVAYGQTESSPCCAQTENGVPLEVKLQTAGTAIPYVEIKIAKLQTGEACPPGVEGEICTRGYHVMKGYYGRPDLTRIAIDEEGFLHTGDLGFLTEEGYLVFSGRIKELIIRGGENISPREIEEIILLNNDVAEVKVYGVASDAYGEEIAASVRLAPGAALTAEALQDFLKPRLAAYKVPRFIEFRGELPQTSSGKIKVPVLQREMLAKIKDEM